MPLVQNITMRPHARRTAFSNDFTPHPASRNAKVAACLGSVESTCRSWHICRGAAVTDGWREDGGEMAWAPSAERRQAWCKNKNARRTSTRVLHEPAAAQPVSQSIDTM